MCLCLFHIVITRKDFHPHLTAVTKTMKVYRRLAEQRDVTKRPLNIVILLNKVNDVNWTCVSTIALFQQDLKDWFEHPCDSRTRIDFVFRFRMVEPVRLCTDNQL